MTRKAFNSVTISNMVLHRKVLLGVARKTPYLKEVLRDRDNQRVKNKEILDELRNTQNKLSTVFDDTRTVLSNKYVRGNGIEVGALHMPLTLPPNTSVQYLDYLPVKKLRKHYPELKKLPLVNVDIVDDGEKLTKVPNTSLNFIIANHFLEHCHDPIGTIVTFYNKLVDGGILYMAVPDKRFTFDMYRPITPYAHLIDEHKAQSAKRYYVEHAREIVSLTELVTAESKVKKRVNDLVELNYSIHYHVWQQRDMIDFFYDTAEMFNLDMEIEAMASNMHEVIFIIRKQSKRSQHLKIEAIQKQYFGKKRPKVKSSTAKNGLS